MRKLFATLLTSFLFILVSSCRGEKPPQTETKGPPEEISKKAVEDVSTRIPQKPSKGRAISLKVLQERVKDCMAKGTCPEEVLRLCGIKRALGYVIDENHKDIILIGEVDDTLPPLHLEDFVIALRSTWRLYAIRQGNTYIHTAPGCSIDPDPRVLNEIQQITGQIFGSSNPEGVQRSLRQWGNVCLQPQKVRVLGIPYDTRFGRVMVEADYYMKRLVDGSVTLDIDGFAGVTDLTLAVVREDIGKGKPISVPLQSLNRFWFFAGENRFLEDKGILYIRKSEVGLLTEEEFLTKREEVSGTGRPNPLAEKFARSFSAMYAEIAKRKPIYAELEGLFRFVALAKVMKFRDAISEAGMSLDYLLNRYPVKSTPVGRTLPGISRVKEFKHKSETQEGYRELYLWLPSCGGVTIDIAIKDGDIARDKTRGMAKMRGAVLGARPSQDPLYWDFSV